MGVIEKATQTGRRLAKEAGDQSIVPGKDKRNHQCAGYGFAQGSLSIPRSTSEQDSVPGAKVVRFEQIGSMVFLNQFIDRPADREADYHVRERFSRGEFRNDIRLIHRAERHDFGLWGIRVSSKFVFELFGKYDVLLGTLLGGHRLHRFPDEGVIPGSRCVNECYQ